MDTKWKSTVKQVKTVLRDNRKLIGGLGLMVITVFFFWQILHRLGGLSTKTVWTLGLISYVPLYGAVSLLLPTFLSRLYRDWIPENGDFYGEWQIKKVHQQRALLGICAGLLVLAFFFFRFQVATSYYYFYVNLAPAYFMIITVILLYIVCQMQVNRFMDQRLDAMMEKVTAMNKARLLEAIELERKSLEKEAKSEQLKVDLISNVSHDLKTPLTSMVGYLELLKKEELDDVASDYVDVIFDKAQKLKEMIESLFSLAKASSGNIQIHPEPVELNMLIEQIFADMDSQIQKSALHFVISMTEEDTHLITDNLHLYRICQNLIENALKYGAKGTRVFVRTYIADRVSGKRLFLEITNTAGYFMDFNAEDIVERFARGDKARSSEGNGLGLAIVSTYAGALGGAFDINIDCDQFKAILSFPIEEPPKDV